MVDSAIDTVDEADRDDGVEILGRPVGLGGRDDAALDGLRRAVAADLAARRGQGVVLRQL